MFGIIDEIDTNSDGFFLDIRAEGTGWGQRLMRRIVDIREVQKLDANNDPDVADTSTQIDTLAKLIFNETRVLPINREPLESNLSTAGIETNALQLPDFIHRYVDMNMPLRDLGEKIGAQVWGVNENRQVVLRINPVDSGILLTNDPTGAVATGWDQTKLGYWEGNAFWRSSSKNMIHPGGNSPFRILSII